MDQADSLRKIIKMNKSPKPLARVIAVTSGKGGVGKSNTSINLAIQLKKMGHRVIILDADFGLANIEIMFGTVPKYNLADLIYRGMGMQDIISWGPAGVGFISGGSGIVGLSNLSVEQFSYIVRSLSQLDDIADFIIVDTGAGISDAVLEFLVSSSEIILVTTPEPTSITDSYSLLKALNQHPQFNPELSPVKVLANRVENEAEGAALFQKFNVVVERYLKLTIEYLGYVPQDPALAKAVMQQTPISLQNENAKAAKAYERVAHRLLFGESSKNVKKRGMATFFAQILSGKKNS